MLQFLTRYLIFLTLGFVVLKLPAMEPFIDLFCLQLAKITAGTLSLLDDQIIRHHATVIRGTYGFSIAVTKECSALPILLTLIGAILTLPSSWATRLKRVLIAVLVVQGVNIIRLMSLVYVKTGIVKAGLPLSYFDDFHLQVWPYMFILTIIAVFIYFAKRDFTLNAA